jgi:glutaredoxin 3
MKVVTIYTTQGCPYCVKAKKLLEKKGVEYEELRVDLNPELIAESIEKSGGLRTVPQIFIGDHHVGGCDDLYALEEQNRLDSLLKE